MNKDKIRQRFAGAAASYDRQAVIQHRVAKRLLDLLDTVPGRVPRQVLEIGSCTGLLTHRLVRRHPDIQTIYLNDLVEGFNDRVSKQITGDTRSVFLTGDIETLELPPDLDLIISSSTFHWLLDLPVLFQRLSRRMTPGGRLAFSMYGPDNLREVREVTGIGLDYFGLEELRELASLHFSVPVCEEELHTLSFADPRALLQHLRETGVNALQTTLWTRKRLNSFVQEYQARYRNKEGVKLTYHPLYCIASKK